MQSAIEYSSRNVQCQAVRKAVKLGKKRVVCRVNTPDKIAAMYIHDIFPKYTLARAHSWLLTVQRVTGLFQLHARQTRESSICPFYIPTP